jgi:Glycosyl hydrolase family 63 C-terminal domain
LVERLCSFDQPGVDNKRLLSLVSQNHLAAILQKMLDETEFLSDYGLRSISRIHLEQPYEFHLDNGQVNRVQYEPAESSSSLFGGNSNWRGPIWFPVNYLMIESLRKYQTYYGDSFKVEMPVGSDQWMTLGEVADEISRRLSSIFLRDDYGHRPVFGGVEIFQQHPGWRDNVLFYEYFHGDNGAGIGASHQTGWTALVAFLLQSK